MGKLVGLLGGATLGLAGAIAYNTSAQTAALEGAHKHLTFGAVVLVAAVAAAVGLIVGYSVDRLSKPD